MSRSAHRVSDVIGSLLSAAAVSSVVVSAEESVSSAVTSASWFSSVVVSSDVSSVVDVSVSSAVVSYVSELEESAELPHPVTKHPVVMARIIKKLNFFFITYLLIFGFIYHVRI